MIMAYSETPEDRALTSQFRLYNGRKIDIRWSGGWLTPYGEFLPVDYKNGITHETLAEQYGNLILGSGSITSRSPTLRLFGLAGWMRIVFLEGSSFCVELQGKLAEGTDFLPLRVEPEIEIASRSRQSVLLSFVRDYKEFESYFINDSKYDTYQEFINAIRTDDVEPVKGE